MAGTASLNASQRVGGGEVGLFLLGSLVPLADGNGFGHALLRPRRGTAAVKSVECVDVAHLHCAHLRRTRA